MIRIITTFHVRPDAVEGLRALAGELVETSQAEDDNLAYDLCVAKGDSVFSAVLRTWHNDAAIETRNVSAYFTTPASRITGLYAEPPSAVQYIEI